jgi:hypothetical protein
LNNVACAFLFRRYLIYLNNIFMNLEWFLLEYSREVPKRFLLWKGT